MAESLHWNWTGLSQKIYLEIELEGYHRNYTWKLDYKSITDILQWGNGGFQHRRHFCEQIFTNWLQLEFRCCNNQKSEIWWKNIAHHICFLFVIWNRISCFCGIPAEISECILLLDLVWQWSLEEFNYSSSKLSVKVLAINCRWLVHGADFVLCSTLVHLTRENVEGMITWSDNIIYKWRVEYYSTWLILDQGVVGNEEVGRTVIKDGRIRNGFREIWWSTDGITNNRSQIAGVQFRTHVHWINKLEYGEKDDYSFISNARSLEWLLYITVCNCVR